MSSDETCKRKPLIGVLALQGAFEEHQHCLEACGCNTKQVRTSKDMEGIDGMVLPGGESTAMGLIGTACSGNSGNANNVWQSLQEFTQSKPTWGTCAGMILLAERCVGTSAVIENGQALIGGIDILVCRNYFGSQISSFEMATPPPPPPPPLSDVDNNNNSNNSNAMSYPGVFIRAPAILSVGPKVQVLGRVIATPCKQAACVLQELEEKIARGEKIIQMGVVDALERKSAQEINYRVVVNDHPSSAANTSSEKEEEKKQDMNSVGSSSDSDRSWNSIELPGAADGSTAREVICSVRKNNLLCTAFHPELTNDLRWHEYFVNMVRESLEQ